MPFVAFPVPLSLGWRSRLAENATLNLQFHQIRLRIRYWFFCILGRAQMSRGRNAVVATGLILFAAGGLAFPFYMATSSKKQPVIDSSKALPPQATFRGPYVNTGSRDIGPDHQTYPNRSETLDR